MALSLTFKSFNSCSEKFQGKEIEAVHVAYDLPLINADGSDTAINTFYDVYYYRDLIMYQLFYRFDSASGGKPVLTEDRNYYFLFNKDSMFGYTYEPRSNKRIPEGRLPVDSVLSKNINETTVYDSLANLKPDSLMHGSEGILIKVYNKSHPEKYPEDYTIYFYYSKGLDNVRETFSKKMDNIKGKKLFKIKIVARGAFYPEYKLTFPKREIVLEMKEKPIENKDQILSYFEKYEEAIKH
jgi:hypothetical protein